MTLEEELRTVWDKYRRHREAEKEAAAIRETADRELYELNVRRAKAGLAGVGVCRDPQGLAAQQMYYPGPSPRTWHDDLKDEIVAVVVRHMHKPEVTDGKA